jgi:hypothetical protein
VSSIQGGDLVFSIIHQHCARHLAHRNKKTGVDGSSWRDAQNLGNAATSAAIPGYT